LDSADLHKKMNTSQEIQRFKRYLATGLRPVSAAAYKRLLLAQDDPRDLKLQHIFECVDELFGENGS
jgi:hypothetical protein